MPGFDSKIFNPEVFGKYVDRIPKVVQNQLIKAGVFTTRNELKTMLTEQTGGNYVTLPMFGLIGGDALNYDGQTDITATSTGTFSQSMVVVGRAKAWTEKDFSADITGVDFMDNVAQQVSDYWDDNEQAELIHILKGIFGGSNAFVTNHTYDISKAETKTVSATTLNSAIQKACGANKGIFKVVICHSVVATNLENLSAIEYLKYTDSEGVQRDLGLGTWNGKLLLIDDGVPTEIDASTATYEKTSDVALVTGKTYYTRSGSAGNYTYTAVTTPDVANIGSYYEQTYEGDTVYISYVLGDGAFTYCDCGAKVPYEMARDPYDDGGKDTLITRQRKLYAPFGFTFTKNSMQTLSPTDAELEMATNWALVSGTDGTVIDHKAIPIAQIKSLG